MAEPQALLEAALQTSELPTDAVVWAPEPLPGVPAPPEGPWVIVTYGEQFVVGAVGRGKFAAYETLWTAEDAIDLAVRLAASAIPLRTAPLTEPEQDAGSRTGQAIVDRAQSRDGAPGANALEPGDLLDSIGAETDHHLYALGTPFPMRSQPPSDVGAPYLTFLVAKALPESVREGVTAPWFEQPGGGAMVVLDRPIRWYVDRDFLAPLT